MLNLNHGGKMNKKILIGSIIITLISASGVTFAATVSGGSSDSNTVSSQDSYTLGTKTVQGVAPQAPQVQNVAPLVKPVAAAPAIVTPQTAQVISTQQVTQVPSAPMPAQVNIAPLPDTMYKLSVYPEQRVVMTPGNELYANYFTFGLGGYSQPNQNIIILDYFKKLPEYNLDTYFHAGHEAGGITGNNSELTTDNMYLKADWNNWTGIVSNTNTQNIIPNMYNNSQTYSVNNNATNLFAIYHFMNDTPQPLNVGLNVYGDTQGGLPDRIYTNTYFNLFANKDQDFTTSFMPGVNHYSHLEGQLYTDAIQNYRTTSLNGTATDKLQFVNDPTLTMNLTGGLEFANNSGQGQLNSKVGADVKKGLSQNYGITGTLGQNSFNTPMSQTLNGFIWNSDVMLNGQSQLQRESQMYAGIGGYATYNQLYSEVKLTGNTSTNTIVYVGVPDGTTNPIIVENMPGTQYSWNVTFNNTYTITEDFRALFNYQFSTLKQVTYSPQNTVNMGVVYTVGAYSITPTMNYYQGMYGALYQNDALNPFWTFNIKNTYQLNPNVALNLLIGNLFNATPDYKQGYPIAGRVVTFSVQTAF